MPCLGGRSPQPDVYSVKTAFARVADVRAAEVTVKSGSIVGPSE